MGEIKSDSKAVTKEEVKPEAKETTVMGMSVVPVEPELQTKLRIKGGVKVTDAEAPASTAGIAEGDIILAANDSDITSPEQFAKVVAGLDKTRAVGLLVRRGDQTQWVAVQPAK